MASRPPPRYVVRPQNDDASQRRRLLWLGLAWLASLMLVGVIVGMLVGHGPVAGHKQELRDLTTMNNDLLQQVANLQRSQQVNEIATKSLRGTLSQRDEEISGLRADVGFYSRLVGGDAQREGLKLQEVQLQPVAQSNAWNLTLSLTQNIKRDEDTTGTATISVEGLRDGKVVQLDWSALGDLAQKDGLPFRFQYFQQLHATFVLPADFRPTRLRIQVQPASGDAVTRTVAWGDALTGHVTTIQGDPDAQP